MKNLLTLMAILFVQATPAVAGGKLPDPLVAGLNSPAGIVVGSDRRIYISERGEEGKEGSGRVVVIEKGKTVPFASGMNDPGAMAAWLNMLFVADKNQIWIVDRNGKSRVFVKQGAFPDGIQLNGMTVDEVGTFYVSGRLAEGESAFFRINPKGVVARIVDCKSSPRALVMDGMSFLLVADNDGGVYRLNVADGKRDESTILKKKECTSLAWDHHGRLYVSEIANGTIQVIPRPGEKPVEVSSGPRRPTSICLDPTGKFILVVDQKAGTVTALPAQVPGQEVDESPMPLRSAIAFPDLKWTGWQGLKDDGRVFPLRPLILTHAGDGSDRVFVGIQQGIIHVFPNDQKAKQTKIFLDIRDRVRYDDKENEQGFLGLAFHPDYKKNGEFFVFYTLKKPKLTNVVSRFRVSKDDPDRADPASEEELIRFTMPYWNHDGGTLCFGPDGFLYIATGDGGAANDPHKNGQKLDTLLAKVLRIDVNAKGDGKNYAIPKDNPFVDKKDAMPEIWAYGLRNPWRMAFDRKTGKLWTSDVGQNLYEEINIIVRGGNYGWSLREGLHPFSKNGVGPREGLIEPIWEYHHDVGKSMTGGVVYRGKNLPELEGHYLYGDFVTSKIWALRYDEQKKRVVANRPIRDPNQPILSFGEDESGEVYFMATTTSGQGIYRFEKTEKK